MQRPSEKATLAWTNVWIDSHKTKEGEGREKINVGVLNPLIAARRLHDSIFQNKQPLFVQITTYSLTVCMSVNYILWVKELFLGDQ